MSAEVRRAADRFITRTGWLSSWHCFSFGTHYDSGNTHFGVLVASNDETLAPGAGFETHLHRDLEIVTWMLSGTLRHEDSAGNTGVVRAGEVQRMTAGCGVRHAERNGSDIEPVRFVQMWVLPESVGLEPSYQQADVTDLLAAGGLVAVASGDPDRTAPVRLHQRATLSAGRLRPHATVALPDAPYLHVYLAAGSAGTLSTGDSTRIAAAVGESLTAGPTGAEVLVWDMR